MQIKLTSANQKLIESHIASMPPTVPPSKPSPTTVANWAIASALGSTEGVPNPEYVSSPYKVTAYPPKLQKDFDKAGFEKTVENIGAEAFKLNK